MINEREITEIIQTITALKAKLFDLRIQKEDMEQQLAFNIGMLEGMRRNEAKHQEAETSKNEEVKEL